MFRILITDSGYKHAVALARYLKRDLPDVHLTAHSQSAHPISNWYSCFDASISGPLQEATRKHSFDMVIPVGGPSVLEVAGFCPALALLPSVAQLETCFDKGKTIEFAAQAGVPVPKTSVLYSMEDFDGENMPIPGVVKASREAVASKSVAYCKNLAEARRAIASQLDVLRSQGSGVLLQEFVHGGGHGFFALMDDGRPVRVFMHQRIREFPPTGGPSTAARAYYSPRLRELGLRLLSALKWRGVAMVEFKLDPRSGDFVLMEINGKFWGSLELALRAGVNFGADLVRMFRGETLSYSEDYDRDCHFYWPLDDDLLTICKTGGWSGLRDYCGPNASTNLGQSFGADLWKTARFLKRVVTE